MADKKLGEVILKNVRLSFADIFEAKAVNDGEPRYSCNFLIDPEDPQIAKIKMAIKDVMQAKWGDNQPKLKAAQFCLRDGSEETWDGYEGMMYVSASNKKRPTVVDRDRSPLTKDDGKPYSGCYVNAVVRVWAQENQYGKRVNASLEAIQFYKDGDAFGAAPVKAEDVFDDLGDDFGDDEDDLPI